MSYVYAAYGAFFVMLAGYIALLIIRHHNSKGG